MTRRKNPNTIVPNNHASWENFGKYMELHKHPKPVIVPTRIEKSLRALAAHAEGRKVSPRTAIAFAVITEWILADLLENAGIVAQDAGDVDVDMKHILKAISRDPEHSAIFVIPARKKKSKAKTE